MSGVRIGLTQRVVSDAKTGERRDALDQKWVTLLTGLGLTPVPLGNMPTDAKTYLSSLGLSGVILTGGNDLALLENPVNAAPERDAFEASVLAFCLENNLPALGVCRGMQMMNVYFGGDVQALIGHVATRHRVEVLEDKTANTVFASDKTFEVNSYHNYGIVPQAMAPDFLPWVRCVEDNSIEAFADTTKRMFGMMWHPEREEPFKKQDLALLRFCFEGVPCL